MKQAYIRNLEHMMDENQMHMVLLFLGGLLFQKIGPVVWIVQWFMLYHNMIEDVKARQKAQYGKRMVVFTITCILCYVFLFV
tara:strand:+ start:245 stop:490 length:246 start_codon:yes stop_codon:yes gene_type:complete